MIAKAKTKDAAAATPVDHIARAETKLAEAEARVADLTRRVHVEMPAEQRKIQDDIDRAARVTNSAAFVEARTALNNAKLQRNAAIDEMDTAKGDAVIAKAELERLRLSERRRETIARAGALVTATHAELLEEQRQIPARLAQATRDLDIDQAHALRQRLAELPEALYAARLLELGSDIERLRTQAVTERAAADALAPELEAAEAHVRDATRARDKIATEINWHRADAQEAERNVKLREGEIDRLAAEVAEASQRGLARQDQMAVRSGSV